MTPSQLEEYKRLTLENRQKGDQILQVTLVGFGASGAVWAYAAQESVSKDLVQWIALSPILIALVLLWWTKQLEHSSTRIVRYVRENLEPAIWPSGHRKVSGLPPVGWENWLQHLKGFDRTKTRHFHRVEVTLALIPALSLFVSAYLLKPSSDGQNDHTVEAIGVATYVSLGIVSYLLGMGMRWAMNRAIRQIQAPSSHEIFDQHWDSKG